MSSRRLPVYLLIDTSGSMSGEPITAVNNGLSVLRASLLQDPQAIDSVWISIITFDRTAKLITELTPLVDVNIPELETPDAGPTNMGEALQLLRTRFAKDIKRSKDNSKGDWAPFLFIMTDGSPSDIQLFSEEIEEIKKLGLANIIGCLAGDRAKRGYLEKFCTDILSLSNMDAQGFSALFRWVSSAIASQNNSLGANGKADLPPTPREIILD
jgi:uncharacterized protein YegL